MMLKKQTVWLLTMVSLVVVLSVYYVLSPSQQASPALDENTDMVIGDEGWVGLDEDEIEVSADSVGDDELFEALRMELQDERSALKEQLETQVASSEFTSAEKNEAYTAMEELTKLQSKEAMVETIITTMGYEDALVRTDGDRVTISVKSDDHSREAANELIQLGRKEMGESKFVFIEFDPVE